jgi:dihydrofolate reductase
MGKLVVCTNVTLDNVMQAPARPDEDTRGGFTRGGWAAPYGAMAHAGQTFMEAEALLFGRRTYLDFHDVWPKRTESPFTPFLNSIRKYVVSRTLVEPLPWENSTLIRDGVGPAVSAIKEGLARNMLVLGSGELIGTLRSLGLVDEWVLLIHPLVLGQGRRLFDADGIESAFSLNESVATPSGVVVATYRSANGDKQE